jgi:hypothetical protein
MSCLSEDTGARVTAMENQRGECDGAEGRTRRRKSARPYRVA